MSSIQQIQLTLPVVNPETGTITEYGRQVLSDFLIMQTNQNTADILDSNQMNNMSSAPQSYEQVDLAFGTASPTSQPRIIEEVPETILVQTPTDPTELVGLVYSLQQEVLLLRQRVEDLENGS